MADGRRPGRLLTDNQLRSALRLQRETPGGPGSPLAAYPSCGRALGTHDRAKRPGRTRFGALQAWDCHSVGVQWRALSDVYPSTV
jgi:hypothetical protein